MTMTSSTTAKQDRRLLILYGTETGNSQDAAEHIERVAERLHFKTVTSELNDIELPVLVTYPLVVIVISTTGQGEIPKNAKIFWKSLLRKRLPPTCLSRLNFTTFGLGDSSYSKFNWAARKLHKRLEQLGASEFHPRGEGDERHEDGIDGTFLPWALGLKASLLEQSPLPKDQVPIPPDVRLPLKFTIELAAERQVGAMAAPSLDKTAAQFSHVEDDSAHAEFLKLELNISRGAPGQHPLARLSEATAKDVPGHIDSLDRPNVLRDDPSKYNLEETNPLAEPAPPSDCLPIRGSNLVYLEENERLTPKSHWQDVRLLSFIVPPIQSNHDARTRFPLHYRPGDTLTVYPKNFPEDVQKLIDLMGWGDVADKPFEHRHGERQHLAPKGCFPLEESTLRQLLIHNYDITAIPKRMFFETLAWHTEDETHKERLREFSDPRFTDEFYDYTSRPRRSILEILHDFPSVKIPYREVPSTFPVIRGREYSIASGGALRKPDKEGWVQVEILVALVKYKTVLRKTRQGLCSRYLASLRPGGSPIPMHVTMSRNDGNISSIDALFRPLLAIAPGTGVAPMRSFIQERVNKTSERQSRPNELPTNLLIYGGRNRNADYFFQREWDELGVHVLTAFSRDQREKVYVQDVIRRESQQVTALLRKNAMVCLCGSSGKMPEAVRSALYDVMVDNGLAKDHDSAKQKLLRDHMYWEEAW